MMHRVFVVSDGTGGTAEHALKAALMQFAAVNVEIERRPEIQTEEQVHQVVQEAAQVKGFIIHTLVTDKLRETMVHLGRLFNVETIDLMGPLLGRLSQQFSISPAEKPGLFSQLDQAYFRRIETMEYAFKHDDGQRIHNLTKAEIVLLGVSRTFKTPLSIYLAFKSWFVANVPIIYDISPPPILLELPPQRVFALTTDPLRLATLRKARQDHLGGATGNYADPAFVKKEVDYALAYFQRQPKWAIVDVTDKPIEEIASEILALSGRA